MSSMKWKTAIRYQVSDMVKPLTIYYIILYGIVGLIQIITRFYNGDTGFSGLEMSSMIFLFFCGVYAFLEDFRFFIQNGLTRKNIFKSQMLLFLFVAVLMGSLELIVENSFVFQEETSIRIPDGLWIRIFYRDRVDLENLSLSHDCKSGIFIHNHTKPYWKTAVSTDIDHADFSLRHAFACGECLDGWKIGSGSVSFFC